MADNEHMTTTTNTTAAALAEKLADPQFRLESARRAYENAQTRAARIAAAEDIEFWSNKTAFLSSIEVA